MKKLKDFSEIENEAYRNTAFNLKTELSQNFPDLIDDKNIEYSEEDDFMYVIVPFRHQAMAEKMTDELNMKLKWNVLFASRNSEGDTYKVILYSKPVQDSMFIATLDSSQFGIIEKIIIRTFDSVEIMLYNLQKLLRWAKRDKDIFILEEQKHIDVLEIFMQ